MPEYPFQNEQTGEVIHRLYTMAEAPSIGSVIDIDGVPHRRLPSDALIGDRFFKPFISEQVARNHPDAPKHDPRGRAVFENRRQLEDFVAKSKDGAIKDGIRWDRD